MTPLRRFLATAALALASSLTAHAQGPDDGGPPPDGQGHGHGRHGPPPEAIAACKGKAVGTQASFTGRNGETITGTCTQMGDVVAIAPPHGAHPPREGASQSTH
jgi:hypothetical protein